jgi:hypothetical protein
MTDFDKKNISLFIQRMNMYMQQQDKCNIISFINGYELGRNNECKFTSSLSDLLNKKYGAVKQAEGWANQIQRLTNSESWETRFIQYSTEVIENE